MKSNFEAVDIHDIAMNAVKLIGRDWMLITAGTSDKFNTMTASWGGLGELWNKPVAFIFIRPQRFTYQFVEESEIFTCSFFDSTYRKALKFCGAYSGRDYDKMEETSLIPAVTKSGGITFEQANIVLECRKLYFQDINPENFLSPAIDKHYPIKDYHRMYVGEIISCARNSGK